MITIPAIDIKNSKCVRLLQGDFANATVYSDDPVAMAQKLEAEGAKMLHIIDLDGAKDGQPMNFSIIKNIAKSIRIPVQVGGGMQTEESIVEALSFGIQRVILGTLALENEQLLKSLVDRYPDRIIVSLDSKNGKLLKNGWLEATNKDLIETAKRLEKLGVQRFIYTNILKDGTLGKPDYESVKVFVNSVTVPVIVAGGVSSTEDIKILKGVGVEGAIIGKALYEGKVDLKEANNVS